ncbi:2-C-methyl-D-erythritol 2,4-cyclodiphosphate synthase [Bythopirellula goksoeyrii]|uniref:2-C-methyl-D-erythritol 2,4-cyclodiphosphate synthase n=1 Tax=Bythopirellula goksoeyrii TaxID=1400387 RepID=A0A5B9QSZ4_9BACT|nr:2-C-methyl-D-erythritol 2,4-cyclodiphosphate synthase [Bythopirellula goksoeyrii]QEG37043.1 2-C-methyl-D-erythritol 2,4-cyclodiphosphate synthase [Bythopirellula goksoeyrii]
MPAAATSSNLRIGLGEDSHRLESGGPLRLGGIEIPHDMHAVGHSDADVLLHAVTDALLGAAGLADIGEMFPDHAEENRGRDSAQILKLAYEDVQQSGYHVVNLDCVVGAQQPKLAPHKQAIRQRMAEILDLNLEQINLKAKTGEGVGPVGNQEIIQARCVALLEANR